MITGSYSKDDVVFLLKDISDVVIERSVEEREKDVQNGRHYSEDLPIEHAPKQEYLDIFHQIMEANRQEVAFLTAVVTEVVLKEYDNPVFVSLVRAGTPTGILMKRYAKMYLDKDIPHYGISIIRDKGFDENAMNYIVKAHPGQEIIFVDGWTGKGVITKELMKACEDLNSKYGTAVKPLLAVLADPASSTHLYATREDFLNPSACLNSVISGLISRTVHNKSVIGPEDFHGVKVYREFEEQDLSNWYVDEITKEFPNIRQRVPDQVREVLESDRTPEWEGMRAIGEIAKEYGILNINRVKPSIGETTRVLLRRVPWKILVRHRNHPHVKHIVYLAEQKGIDVIEYPDMPYECCGLIANKAGGDI